MSDFWNLSDGTTAQTSNTMEMGGGDIPPIPGNTELLAVIDEAKLDTDFNQNEIISLRWSVLQPEEYKNRKIFHKVRVFDADAKKADKAKRMLMAIDTNAGGKFVASGQAPNDTILTSALCMKQMLIKVQVWKMKNEETGEENEGNWVSAVSPKGSAPAQPVVAPTQGAADNIPF